MSVENEIADVKRLLNNLGNQLIVIDMKLDKTAAVHDERMRGFDHRIDALERAEEDTGKHIINIAEKRADSGFWWKKQSVLAVGALVMLVLSSCASAGVTIAVTKLIGGHP